MTDSQEREYYVLLGQQFKKLRKRVGKTIEEVADAIGVQVALIAQFENNGKKISASEAVKTAEQWGEYKGLASFYLEVAEYCGINPGVRSI